MEEGAITEKKNKKQSNSETTRPMKVSAVCSIGHKQHKYFTVKLQWF